MAGSSGNTQLRELLLVIGPAVLLCIGAFWLAFQFAEPADAVRFAIQLQLGALTVVCAL